MNLIKKNWSKLILLLYIFLLPISTLQAVVTCDPKVKICNQIDQNDLNTFIKTLLEGILKIGIPILALAIIFCGFMFVEARGKPEKITKAKDALFYTLIGGAILLGAWALSILISETILKLG